MPLAPVAPVQIEFDLFNAPVVRPPVPAAEKVAMQLGIPIAIVPPSRISGQGGCIHLKSERRTGVVILAKIRLCATLPIASATGQWCLWHELAHFLDLTERPTAGDRRVMVRAPRHYGRFSAKHLGDLLNASREIASLKPIAVSIKTPVGTVTNTHEINALDVPAALKARLARRLYASQMSAYRYKVRPCELYAEAVACQALDPDRLRAIAPALVTMAEDAVSRLQAGA